MLPNRTAAILLAALMLAPLVPVASAGHASGHGPDLVPWSATVVDGIVGIRSKLVVEIKNIGDAEFSRPEGWQVFVSMDMDDSPSTTGEERTQCIDRDADQSDCYRRFNATDSRFTTIPKGETRQFEMWWDPTTDQGGSGKRLWVRIEGLGEELVGGGNTQFNPSGPDAFTANNMRDFSVFVAAPAVRAVPDRVPPNDPPTAKVNDGWNYDDVTAACANSTEITRSACKAQPGAIVNFHYKVINLGNKRDTFTGRWVDDYEDRNNRNMTERGYQVRFTPERFPLDPNESRDVKVSIVVPRDAPVNDDININRTTTPSYVHWTSALNPAVNTESTFQFYDELCTGELEEKDLCRHPTLPTLVVALKRGLIVNSTFNETRFHVRVGGDPAVFNVTLNNTGNSHERYSMRIRGEDSTINDSWKPILSPPSNGIAPYSTGRASVQVTPPSNASAGPHPFTVLFQSTGDVEGVTLTPWTFTADLLQFYEIEVTPDSQLKRAVPDEATDYTLTLRNDGNGWDNYTLRLDNRTGGWDYRLSNETVAIPPFSSREVTLTVRAPRNATAELRSEFFVNVSSAGYPGMPERLRAYDREELEFEVLRGPSIQVPEKFVTTIDPGQNQTFDVLVQNTGNTADIFRLSTEVGDVAWIANVEPREVELQPLRSATVRVTLRAPGAAEVGERTTVLLHVDSTVDPGRSKEVTFDARISGPDLYVGGVLLNATTPYSGDPLEVSVVVGNAGNKAPPRNATLVVTYVQDGVPREILTKQYAPGDLGPGRRFSEVIRWDTTGIEGDGVILARIDPNDAIVELDDPAQSNQGTKALTLRTLELILRGPQPLSGRPGERVSYAEDPNVLRIEYRGNQPFEAIRVIAESANGWASLNTTINLPRNTLTPVNVTVNIPREPGVPQDELRFTVYPVLRENARRQLTTVTTVVDDRLPVIQGVTATPPLVDLGEPVTLRALVRDETGLSAVRAVVVTPANETVSLSLSDDGSGTWSFAQAWDAPGVYRLYVEATDRAEGRNTNSTRDTAVTFTVSPGSEPVIRLADGQVSTVRTGTLVRLNISDPLGIARATYSVKGITYELPRPYQIDTSSFQAGVVEVTVTAANVYGVESTAKFTLTIDNAPPGIRQVTVSPENPKANEDVVVRIETDAKVTAVDVLIKRDGQVVETRAAERKGAGAFELLLNPGEGDYEIDVTAKDAAGNQRLQEGAVVFSAKPAGIPGPGLVVLLAALAGLALARRRRG